MAMERIRWAYTPDLRPIVEAILREERGEVELRASIKSFLTTPPAVSLEGHTYTAKAVSYVS